jgi:secretion/DNA translocation related CpaE-like protein
LRCGADDVLDLPADASRVVGMLLEAGDVRRSAAYAVGVLGGAGGVGASLFAAAVALTCARRVDTVLVDADRWGAGLDQLVGVEPGDGVRWDALLGGRGRLSGRSVRDALPRRGRLSLLGWPDRRPDTVSALPEAITEIVDAVRRSAALIVVDLGRHPDPLVTEFTRRIDLLMVVTTTSVPAVTAAARTLRRSDGTEAAVVVRRTTGGLAPETVGALLERPVWATMAPQRGLDEDLGLGAGPLRRSRGPLARTATRVADRILKELAS